MKEFDKEQIKFLKGLGIVVREDPISGQYAYNEGSSIAWKKVVCLQNLVEEFIKDVNNIMNS